MRRVTMRIRGPEHSIETTGFAGSECRTPTLERLAEELKTEVISDEPTPEALHEQSTGVLETA